MNAPEHDGLCDLVEDLGRRVQSGQLSRETAIQWVFEFSDGGLTLLGAESALDRWKTLRAGYAEVFCRARAALDQIDGGAS